VTTVASYSTQCAVCLILDEGQQLAYKPLSMIKVTGYIDTVRVSLQLEFAGAYSGNSIRKAEREIMGTEVA